VAQGDRKGMRAYKSRPYNDDGELLRTERIFVGARFVSPLTLAVALAYDTIRSLQNFDAHPLVPTPGKPETKQKNAKSRVVCHRSSRRPVHPILPAGIRKDQVFLHSFR